MNKICHMSSAHRGLDVRIFQKECVTLANAGYDTHLVITATCSDVIKAAAKGVALHPLQECTSRFVRIFKQTWCCYRVARSVKAEIYHFHDPELIPYGILLKLAGRCVIYDVHEDMPQDVLSKAWIPPWVRKLVAVMVAFVEYVGARWFFSVIAATPFIMRRFLQITPRVVGINNYPLPNELAFTGLHITRQHKICYVGGIARARGIEPLIRALPLVPDVKLVLCGRFQESELETVARALPGWQQVDYRGEVDRDGVRQVLCKSMAGIVTFLPVPNHVNAQPNKMFEYMSAELPVIASDFPLWREIIEVTGAGICVDPQSPEAIAHAIRSLLNDPTTAERMGKAGRKAVLDKYNWPNERAKLLAFYSEL